MPPFLFITGTDTGVGKTVLTALLCRHLVEQGVRVAALKPICSGGRDDAKALRAALKRRLTLDEINPWHFACPIAPSYAAKLEGKRVRLREVVAHCRRLARRFEVVLVEGAGGLLSPLGEDFDSRDLLLALDAAPVVVCPLRVGAINQARLVFDALPAPARRRAQLVLAVPGRADQPTNLTGMHLYSFFQRGTVQILSHLRHPEDPGLALESAGTRQAMRRRAEHLLARALQRRPPPRPARTPR